MKMKYFAWWSIILCILNVGILLIIFSFDDLKMLIGKSLELNSIEMKQASSMFLLLFITAICALTTSVEILLRKSNPLILIICFLLEILIGFFGWSWLAYLTMTHATIGLLMLRQCVKKPQ